ncbi:hypothetical protein [Arthrobacter sp. zg-Y179]|uniref:hypothetical protein n=1 Tax=Arthrobacter sp. zg-Y179 TaxID=2894188 RepID=UPI001E44FD13|nr:hypothetical protein [Arthrobacter sp. zg-Y179]MCC9174822.1 hypothetical protein [Arthrobacter sp. zg-Y179]
MENNLGAAEDAAARLRNLAADRNALAAGAAPPRTLLAGLGGVAACWVAAALDARPGADYQSPSWTWLLVGLLFVILHMIQRDTGLKFRRLGARANGAIALAALACLFLFSVSLGLVSLGLGWAVMITSLAAFAAVYGLAVVAYRAAVDHLRTVSMPHA